MTLQSLAVLTTNITHSQSLTSSEVVILIGAVIGLLTAILTAVTTMLVVVRKLDGQGTDLREIRVQVNGNLQQVKDQLTAAITHIANTEEAAAHHADLTTGVNGTTLRDLQHEGVLPTLPLPPAVVKKTEDSGGI